MTSRRWDITTLITAAQSASTRVQRNLWLVQLVQWLCRRDGQARAVHGTPYPLVRLRHLLNLLDKQPALRQQVVALLARIWQEGDAAELLAGFGLSERRGLASELWHRLGQRLLPANPDTDDLGVLFGLMFAPGTPVDWLAEIDPDTLDRLARLFAHAHAATPRPAGQAPTEAWREPAQRALAWLATEARAAALSPALRRRMGPTAGTEGPFDQLDAAVAALGQALQDDDDPARRRAGTYLHTLLSACHAQADQVHEHLNEHGVSVNIVHDVAQLHQRLDRMEALLNLQLSPTPGTEMARLMHELARLAQQRASMVDAVRHSHALLARKVAERHAATGEHYIARNATEYRQLLAKAAGGGAVIAFTTFGKFALAALALAPFWDGLSAGLNYALSFLLIHLLHWTVATKQPAMTAPALAARLAELQARGAAERESAVQGFVDEVAQLVRSQVAGVIGNLGLVIPVVLLLQTLAWFTLGRPLIDEAKAHHVLDSLTLLGPTALFAAFTGVILFASSLVAGWVENWFVYHQLPGAIAHHPAIVARLGAARAERWSRWWRANIGGVTANVSLGLMLGLIPALLAFVGLPLQVRHVTLSTGQLSAAAFTLGPALLLTPAFWWCVAGVASTGVLNLVVSFWLALRTALRARGIAWRDRQLLRQALWQRLRHAPLSFLLPR